MLWLLWSLWSWLHPIPRDSFYQLPNVFFLKSPPPEKPRNRRPHAPTYPTRCASGSPDFHHPQVIILWVAKTTYIYVYMYMYICIYIYVYIYYMYIYVYIKYSLSHESSGDDSGMDIGFYMFCHSNGRAVGIEFSTCMFDLWRCFGVNEFDPDLATPELGFHPCIFMILYLTLTINTQGFNVFWTHLQTTIAVVKGGGFRLPPWNWLDITGHQPANR